MGDFLAEAIAESRRRVARWKAEKLLEMLEAAPVATPARDLAGAIRRTGPLGVLAEFKRASPSRGVIHANVDPQVQARAYVRGGATAVSVVTESRWFHGQIKDLQSVRAAIAQPILRKDFVVDDEDIVLSRKVGADAVLLIVACLSSVRLEELMQLTLRNAMTPLVEVHDRRELDVALAAGAKVIGVNSRNLRTLEVECDCALEVLPHIPSTCIRVFESGVKDVRDLQAAKAAGADAVLVGETLMRAPDPSALIQSWLRYAGQTTLGKYST